MNISRRNVIGKSLGGILSILFLPFAAFASRKEKAGQIIAQINAVFDSGSE